MEENQQPETSPAWRYVIYARKSTESAEKQVRSIDDQIRDCKALAKELGLTVIGGPITEEMPAKYLVSDQSLKSRCCSSINGYFGIRE